MLLHLKQATHISAMCRPRLELHKPFTKIWEKGNKKKYMKNRKITEIAQVSSLNSVLSQFLLNAFSHSVINMT